MSKPDFLFFLPRPRHPRHLGPGLHLRWRLGWLKGALMRPYWKLRGALGGTKIEIGRRFSLQGSLIARGPGRLLIGDDCIVAGLCTPFTHAARAKIRIGSRVFLNGTRFGCAQQIEVGDDCILADARIMDTDFHSVDPSRNTQAAPAPKTRPIKINRNVWVAASAALLKGVEIGEDSVIGFGSVVSSNVPAGRIFGGNPAQDVGPTARV